MKRERLKALAQLICALAAVIGVVVGLFQATNAVGRQHAAYQLRVDNWLMENNCERVNVVAATLFEPRETIYKCKSGLVLSSELKDHIK